MREWIDFVATYPMWVKVLVGVLVGTILVLLIAFKPPAPDKGAGTKDRLPTVSPQAPRVGRQIVLDISDGQEEWKGLAAWASASNLGIVKLDKPFDAKSFDGGGPGVLILPLPYRKLLSDSKVRSVKSWVEQGGGLLVFGYYAADTHHGSNISRLTREWGVSFTESLLMPVGAQQVDTRRHVFSVDERFGVRIPVTLGPYSPSGQPIVAGVSSLVVLSAAYLDVQHASVPLAFRLDTPPDTGVWQPRGPLNPDGMRPLIEEWVLVGSGRVPVLVAFTAGLGKVAVVGSWKLATLNYGDNLQLTQNLINWLRP